MELFWPLVDVRSLHLWSLLALFTALSWQIELAFKRLKSLLHIDRLPTWTAQASRSWLYAHLIMALLCDDLSQDFLDTFP